MTYYPLSGYEIDSNDMYGTWKITVKRIAGLKQFLDRKGDVSQSWPDSDGEESFTNASDIYFKGRDIIMFLIMRADTMTAFNTQLTAFKAVLEGSGLRTFGVPHEATTYSLMYLGGSDITWRTPKQNSNLLVGEFWIKFREPSPTRS